MYSFGLFCIHFQPILLVLVYYYRVSNLAGKAGKRAFFQILAGNAGKTSLFATALAEKAGILFFPLFSVFIGQLNITYSIYKIN